jgi:hypothetical protein
MSRAFDPKKVLKHISNPLLREFFDRRGELHDVPWDDLTEHRIDPVFDAWEALPDGKANEVQCILREVHALASERGAKALAEVIAEHLPVRQNEFAAIGSKHDKALWCCLHAPKLFEMASVFAEADGLEAGNQWKTRNGLPRGPLDVTPARIAALEGEVKAFFSTRELRGRHCHVAHHSRPCGTEYFFAYLDDYPDRDMVFEEGSDVPVPLSVRSAFQVVFAFDTKRGEFSAHAKGGAQVWNQLQVIFCRCVLGLKVDPTEAIKPVFDIAHLVDPSFHLSFDAADGIESAEITAIRVKKPVGYTSVEVKVPPKGGRKLADELADWIKDGIMVPGAVKVDHISIAVKLAKTDTERASTMQLAITAPNSCNLKGKSDRQRRIGEKLLKSWGVTIER